MRISRRGFLATLAAAGTTAATGPTRRAAPYRAGRSDLDSGIACARMAMSFFEPGEHFPVADLAEMTSYTDGRWFFEPQLAPIMLQKGRRVELYSDLDYHAIAMGRGLDRFGPDAGKMIDRKALQWALDAGAAAAVRPALELPAALEKWSAGGFLLLSVDRGTLRGEAQAYCRYFVAVTGFGGNVVRFHDPSLGPDRELPINRMTEAFGHPAAGRAALLIR